MPVRDRANLDGRPGAQLADGLRAACGAVFRRLAVLFKREPVAERNARLQGAAGDRPVRHTVVHHDVGLFRHRFRPVGLVRARKRTVAARLEPDEEQKAGKSCYPVTIHHPSDATNFTFRWSQKCFKMFSLA